MSILTLLVTASLARAHGSAQSHELMVELARAINRPDLVIAAAEHQPPDDEGIAASIASLSDGILFVNRTLAAPLNDLRPAQLRAWSCEAGLFYDAHYRALLTEFRDALVAYRGEFLVQGRRPAAERTAVDLRRMKAHHTDLSLRAHREL